MMRVLMQRLSARSLTLIVLETALIIAAVAIAAYVRLGEFAWEIARNENGIGKALLIALVTQTCLYYADMYDLRLLSDRRELFTRLLQALAPASFILAAYLLLVSPPDHRTRRISDRGSARDCVRHRLEDCLRVDERSPRAS
jgi:hypothetical protein